MIATGRRIATPTVDSPPSHAASSVMIVLIATRTWLQDRRVDRRTPERFAKRAYLMLSLAAKSALAWRGIAGTVAGR